MKKQTKPGDLYNAYKHKMEKKKKNWIQGAIKNPGALHRELGVKEGKKIPTSKLAAASKKGGKIGKRARLAETLKGFKNKSKKKMVAAIGTPMKVDPSKFKNPAWVTAGPASPATRARNAAMKMPTMKPTMKTPKMKSLKKKGKKKMTESQDKAIDRKKGIKEGSKRDLAMDKKMGVKQKTMCKKHKKVMCKMCK